MGATLGAAWWLACQFSPWKNWRKPSHAMFWLESWPGRAPSLMWAMELTKHWAWRAKTSRTGPSQKKAARPKGRPMRSARAETAICVRVQKR